MDLEMEGQFEELKSLINDSFLDKNLKCRKIVNEETLEEEFEQYVTLQSIHYLKLSEEEELFVVNYLGTLGISVRGIYSYYSGVCDNYTQSGHFSRKNAVTLSMEEQKAYLEEYQKTKDREARNLVVESNLPLVKYLTKQYSYRFDVDKEWLESYGVEGLIKAMDTYDSSRGKLSTYLSLKIRSALFKASIDFHLGESGVTLLNKISDNRKKGTKYFEYIYVKEEVEKKTKKKVKDNPELIEDIIQELVNRGYGNEEKLKELKSMVSICNALSYEQIEDNLHWVDDDTLYRETLEEMYQGELKAFIMEMRERLTPKKRQVLNKFYGFDGEESCPFFKKIAAEFYCSRQAVFHNHRLALEQIEKRVKFWKRVDITNSFVENSNHEYEDNLPLVYIKTKRK